MKWRGLAWGAALSLGAMAAMAALVAAGGPAAELDQSLPCQQALAALDARQARLLAAAGSPAPGADATWLALRRAAARACLGADADSAPPPRRTLKAPIEITAPGALRAPDAPVLAAPQRLPAAPLPAPTPPLSVSACDATGCWTSAGTRLPRVGAGLLGPRGVCTVQGSLLVCP